MEPIRKSRRAPPTDLGKRQPRRRNEACDDPSEPGDSGARKPSPTRHNTDGRPYAKLDDSIRPTTGICRRPSPTIQLCTKPSILAQQQQNTQRKANQTDRPGRFLRYICQNSVIAYNQQGTDEYERRIIKRFKRRTNR